MKIFENNDKDVFIKKLEQNKYLIQIPYNKQTKQGQKRKIFWTNFPWHNLKIIKMSSTKDELRDVIVQSESVMTLSEFLTRKKHNIGYPLAMRLFTDVGNQLKTLEQFNIFIAPLSFEDIVIIGNHFFIMEDTKNIAVFSNKITLQMTQTKMVHEWKKNKFVGPEILKLKSLPADVSIKSSYYNIASLVIFVLFKKYVDHNKDTLEEILQNIKNTKLYWALIRCLEENVNDRFFLII